MLHFSCGYAHCNKVITSMLNIEYNKIIWCLQVHIICCHNVCIVVHIVSIISCSKFIHMISEPVMATNTSKSITHSTGVDDAGMQNIFMA